MPISVDLRKIPLLWKWRLELLAEGEAKGKAEGKAEGEAKGEAKGKTEGMSTLLREQLEIKFGRLPRWADHRLTQATPVQLERWAKKVLTADSLQSVVGPRQRRAQR
jgi:hypothetical protein